MEIISLNPLSRFSSLPLHTTFQPKSPLYSISFSLTPPHPRKPLPLRSLQPQDDAPSIPSLRLLLSALRSVCCFCRSHARTFRSCLHGGLGDGDYEAFGAKCACNGGIGTVLMSTAAASRAQRVRPFLWALAANPTFVSGLAAWALAQTIKVLLNFFVEWRWDFGVLFSSGGMPSSHSALCMALTSSVAICHGVGDALFPVCLGFSLIVMYDAIGVRRHAGMQAEVLNKIVEDLFQGHPISQRKLKELLGHTPSQVIAGALLGILVACICCQGYAIAT